MTVVAIASALIIGTSGCGPPALKKTGTAYDKVPLAYRPDMLNDAQLQPWTGNELKPKSGGPVILAGFNVHHSFEDLSKKLGKLRFPGLTAQKMTSYDPANREAKFFLGPDGKKKISIYIYRGRIDSQFAESPTLPNEWCSVEFVYKE